MEPGFHALSDLFKQLGLPSDNGSVQQFIMEHAPLPDAMRLEDAPCWAPAQAALLRAVGCDYAQGWLFGRPQALADLEALWAQAARGLPDEAPWPVSRR